jgi:hypothetical protein
VSPLPSDDAESLADPEPLASAAALPETRPLPPQPVPIAAPITTMQ